MFPRSSFDGSTPEEANTAGGKQGQWRGRSRRRPFQLERPREKLRRSMIAFDRFPFRAAVHRPVSVFRASPRNLARTRLGNRPPWQRRIQRFGPRRLLIDANFSIHPRDSTTLGDRISFGTGKNLGEIRFDRERRIFVIALLRLLRLFVYRSPLFLSLSLDLSTDRMRTVATRWL